MQIISKFYDAINANDIEALSPLLDHNVVRVEFEGFPTAGTYRGIDAVKAHIKQGRSTWSEGACLPEKILTNGDKVVVFAHVRAKVKGEWVEGRFADTFVIENEKIREFNSVSDRDEALAWAGITP